MPMPTRSVAQEVMDVGNSYVMNTNRLPLAVVGSPQRSSGSNTRRYRRRRQEPITKSW